VVYNLTGASVHPSLRTVALP